ncbi:MAG: ATP-dependent DNA helicase RecG [Deltaproteobacteria bacterium]|nr:ATP-dependent DNA helicase RecG [Deltaproteobacteria bacterium]
MSVMLLSTSTKNLQYLQGVGPQLARLFEAKNIISIEDLLNFSPRTYEDRRNLTTFKELEVGMRQTSKGIISSVRIIPLRKRSLKILECLVTDESSSISLKWFHFKPDSMKKMLTPGRAIVFSGEVQEYRNRKHIVHPDFEIEDATNHNSLHFGRIIPIYSITEGLYQKTIRKIIKNALNVSLSKLEDPLPQSILQKYKLISLKDAYQEIHFPHSSSDFEKTILGYGEGRRRLVFDDFFFFELGLALRKFKIKNSKAVKLKVTHSFLDAFSKDIPFELTTCQKKAIVDILDDVSSGKPMNRLLQGDVGSGKTLVAIAATLLALHNNIQTAIMAPTEILAEQHFKSFQSFLSLFDKKLSLSVRLLTSSLPQTEKTLIKKEIQQNIATVLIGTHAVLCENVQFSKLGLMIIDEQHRFGVHQRLVLKEKSYIPHTLVMTATPIPRTLALTAYGELDVSVMKEMPKGRKAIKTKLLHEEQKPKLYQFILKQLEAKRQIYCVYPLIEESETLDLKDATQGAEKLNKIFQRFKVTLLHGKMKAEEKNAIMQDFKNNKIHILVSTTVVEVGVDVPNATIMVIEHAERFGLSQLHQLRGRVGRSDLQSYCFLLVDKKVFVKDSWAALERLKTMEKTIDGFEIAQADLRIRGEGEILGTKQAGFLNFRFASLVKDQRVLGVARKEAFQLVLKDPTLSHPENKKLKEHFEKKWSHKFSMMEGN